jgi:glycogen debranching enzyme
MSLVVLDGSTFFLSEPSGDTSPEDEAQGFFFADVRHLSEWKLEVEGKHLDVLTSRNIDYYSARVFATPMTSVGRTPPISIQRDRIVADGVHEDVFIVNHSNEEQSVNVAITFGADFADIFEIKDKMGKRGRFSTEVEDNEVTLWYERNDFRRGTRISLHTDCEIKKDRLVFDIRVGPRQTAEICMDISPMEGDQVRGPRMGHGGIGKLHPQTPLTMEEWLASTPDVETDKDIIQETYRQSLIDLVALRFRPTKNIMWSLPAAGLPWFMALFGRDSLITAYQSIHIQPLLANATLGALSGLQALDYDDFQDSEPGKILHELRHGELATLGEVPHSPYFGTHDATLLFLILLDEYERWTGDADFVKGLEEPARRAIEWMEGPGDLDGDGYLEYKTRSSKGLENQCWKDSWNSMLFSDGTIAKPPIATCEIQGYAYDARIRTARIARAIWKDEDLASRLESAAADLKDRFNRDYWNEERGHYALALDGSKRQVDSLTSNTGQLLWSGIVPEDRASSVVKRLMGDDMFSGWGIRTMSVNDLGFSPIEYHNGTVWPHDTSLAAEGMRRYGFRDEASRLCLALYEAAAHFAFRLPEVFAGFPRAATEIPVEYPTASRPQAWSAGAPLLALRTMLGLDPVEGKLNVDPHLPAGISNLTMRRVVVHGHPMDATAQ